MYSYIVMDKAGFEWFNCHVPVLAVEDSCGIIAINNENEYIGGCVLDNWTETSVQCSFLIDNPMLLRDKFFHKCATLIFNEMARKLVYVLVPSNNEKSLNFVTRMGFTEQARLKGAFKDGVDYVILELKKENCRHLLAEVA